MPRIIRATEEPVYVSREEAAAALWVIENCRFSGRKHLLIRDFVERVTRQGIDLKAQRLGLLEEK